MANGADAVITFTAGERKPAAELELDGERQEASLGTHCWTSDSAGFCADYAGVSAPEDPLVLPQGTTLRVDGDAQSVEGVIGILIDQGGYGEVKSRQRLSFSSGEDTIDVPPGEYVISLFTLWKQGDASMAFSIRVV